MTPPEEVFALARSLYHKDPGKQHARDWAAVQDRIRQIRDRFTSGSDLARGFIDDFFATELGAKPNTSWGGNPVFSFTDAMEAAMNQAELMSGIEEGMVGQHAAGRILLDWYAENGNKITRGSNDKNGVPERDDGSRAPPKLSTAEDWLHGQLIKIDPSVSAGAAQTVVKKYLQMKAASSRL